MAHHATHDAQRRQFLRRTAQMALGGTALPLALNMAAMGEAAAFNAPAGDYKALVCIFLTGGNDYANTLVPFDDANYNLYSTIRGGGAGQTAGGIALAKSSLAATLLTPLSPPLDSQGQAGRQFALHPSMTALAQLFNTGKMAVQLNVGPLVKPLTRTQYVNADKRLYPRPRQLFSHNDQQSVWQSSSPEGAKAGWGGHLGDKALENSLNATSVFTNISVAGNAVYLSGDMALQYQVSTGGAIKIKAATASTALGHAALPAAVYSMLHNQTSAHKLENEYLAITRRALDSETTVSAALAAPAPATVFPADALGKQLQMVARLIQGHTVLGVRRQVYFVSIGGFDLHDNLIRDHGGLLGSVSDAMAAFYNATVAMGLERQVTAFTASDFGRTLTSNGDGSDHGWGGHHFVVGGAVNGQRFYGEAPPINVTDGAGSPKVYAPAEQWHVGQGRLLPRTSVDQYAATLAKWFGVTDAEMPQVLANINNFGVPAGRPDYPWDLGFMA
ncbi:MAG: DUF1501 domain-containing protein [Rhodoferax sp.]|nr:DUF1501 domain-containing protein [Rhodoferax sp.]